MMEIIGDEKQLKIKDFHGRSFKSLKHGLGRLLGRRSVTITEYDPTYKVVYLGNVLTGWAKGDSCTEKPLNTLWKNYTSNSKPDVQMKLIVTQSGLKAITKEHGLTEYWSHRITFCSAPTELPKIFCWVYRHEGRKLKQELRCHAVLCTKESVARQIANQLQARLTQALIEFKRDKISRQNARLSLANSVYENPSLPRRKILLSTGSHNYRPPLERSKSAPKLMAIEESLEEDDECGGGNGYGLGGDYKKACKSKFATCRNLSYSNRGYRMGGLHGSRMRAATTTDLLPPSTLKNLLAVNRTTTNTVATITDSSVTTSPIAIAAVSSLRGNDADSTLLLQNENSSQFDENECRAEELVEQNPFGGWKQDCEESLLEAFVREMSLQEKSRCADAEPVRKLAATPPSSVTVTDISENICDTTSTSVAAATATKCTFLLRSVTNDGDVDHHHQPSLCPSYEDTLSRATTTSFDELPPRYDEVVPVGKYDSLVRSRRKMFENADKGWDDDRKTSQTADSCATAGIAVAAPKDMVKNRRKLFECAEKVDANSAVGGVGATIASIPAAAAVATFNGDAHSALHFDFDGDEQRDSQEECVSCSANDDDSATPSLQSISSCSDTSSPRGDLKLEFSKNDDLDLLWEEDSDESGFVESIGCQDTNDDKIRDLPHHHLVKSCILSSKSRCVEV